MKTEYKLYFKFAENSSYQERDGLYPSFMAARAATHLGNPAEAYDRAAEWQVASDGVYVLSEKILKQMGRSSPWLIEEVQTPETDAERIQLASELAVRYGMIDGAHHKQWVIDQMLRLILGDKYAETVALDPEDEGEYEPWDEGIAP